jgi:DNA polymerase-3 subunit delta
VKPGKPPVLASGDVARVYLLWGEDEGALVAALAAIRAAVLRPDGQDSGMDAFNHESFDAPYLSAAAAVLNACDQMPMMAAQRLVELSAPEDFGKHKRQQEDDGVARTPESKRDDAIAALIEYMQSPNPSCVLVISSTGIKGTSKLVKAAKKAADAGLPVLGHRFARPDDDRAASELVAEARRRDIPLSRDAAELMVRLLGTASAELHTALERAHAYAGGAVNRDHVAEVVRSTREANVFDLTDAIGSGDAAAALTLLAKMFELGEKDTSTAMRLLGMLLWHMRRLFVVREAADPARALNLRPFALRKLSEQAARLDEQRLRKAYSGLARLDHDLKGGSKLAYESPYLVLQRWVLDVCGALPGTDARI